MAPRRIPPGKSVKVKSSSFNAFVDAANYVQNAQTSGAPGALGFSRDSSIFRIKNITGAAVPRHGVMQINGPIITPATDELGFLQQMLLGGGAPASGAKVAIALEPIANNDIGLAMAPGVLTPVKVSLPDNLTYRLCRPSTSTSTLDAIATDDIQEGDRLIELIWHETGPGTKWAVALMPGILRQGVTVLGPCGVYNPAAELEDSAFDVAFGGCLWPSRYGLAYNNLAGGSSVWRNLELESVGGTLLYSSNEFSHQCFIGSITVYLQLEFSSRNAGDGEIRFVRASDDVVVAWAENRFFRWSPLKGGRMQFQDSICSCASFPQELCLSPPSR